MSLAQVLQDFKNSVADCDGLIANAHKQDSVGAPIFPHVHQRQITTAAFLNLFISWEAFLEASLLELMVGAPTINGTAPVRYVMPIDISSAHKMVLGILAYFDFAKHENVIKVAKMYFLNGYPFEPHMSSIISDLNDLRTMRNASAHISSTTQTALESLALRIFGKPQLGVTVYRILTAVDPRSSTGDTVFVAYRDKLTVTAELIANG
jgi:hypothetical protein